MDLSPDGESIVTLFSHGRSAGGDFEFDFWTIPVNDGRLTRLTSDGSRKEYPSWSPDGRWVAFVGYGRQEGSEGQAYVAIFIVPAEGGEIRQVSSAADSVGARGISFTPDGKRIAFFSGRSIKTIPVEGGQPELLIAGIAPTSGDSKPAYSPDGSSIAYNAGGKIWVTSLVAGVPQELRTSLPEIATISSFGWSPDGKNIAFVASTGGEPEFFLISGFLPEGR